MVRRSKEAGLTLIEILMVMALVAVVTGAAVVGYRSVRRAEVRGSAQKLAAAIRYLYDRSVVTGRYYRLTIDLDKASYEAQVSDDRFYLNAEKEKAPGRGQAFDADAQTKALDEEDRKRDAQNAGLAAQLQPPPRPKRAHFESYKDAMLPKIEMRGSFVRDLYTPRQSEPYYHGKAHLYFFPDGHVERAVLHVSSGKPLPPDEEPPPRRAGDDDIDVYTLVLHPLSGRVELKVGDFEVPSDFDSAEDSALTERMR